jgi:hypothetical protein
MYALVAADSKTAKGREHARANREKGPGRRTWIAVEVLMKIIFLSQVLMKIMIRYNFHERPKR